MQAVEDEGLSLVTWSINANLTLLVPAAFLQLLLKLPHFANRAGAHAVWVFLKPSVDAVQMIAMATKEFHLLLRWRIRSAFDTARAQ
mmetsp:Transcript_79152/g.96802  ORF Transcript_79152/g.96802 Transcript_79152/m.96802 type:complete len:87 (-) Transcript_79152:143-403(-)